MQAAIMSQLVRLCTSRLPSAVLLESAILPSKIAYAQDQRKAMAAEVGALGEICRGLAADNGELSKRVRDLQQVL